MVLRGTSVHSLVHKPLLIPHMSIDLTNASLTTNNGHNI